MWCPARTYIECHLQTSCQSLALTADMPQSLNATYLLEELSEQMNHEHIGCCFHSTHTLSGCLGARRYVIGGGSVGGLGSRLGWSACSCPLTCTRGRRLCRMGGPPAPAPAHQQRSFALSAVLLYLAHHHHHLALVHHLGCTIDSLVVIVRLFHLLQLLFPRKPLVWP